MRYQKGEKMPRYDFRCDKCEKVEEESLTVSQLDGFKKECEKCSTRMKRIYRPKPTVWKTSGNADRKY